MAQPVLGIALARANSGATSERDRHSQPASFAQEIKRNAGVHYQKNNNNNYDFDVRDFWQYYSR